ncbi:MAG: hypothetical protein BMS9Abin05_2750 [Rhodothermia bacterium]|nr:MAG: hypothetical protein BMS9Abin05_2750 [Rhodothermia bacterium]
MSKRLVQTSWSRNPTIWIIAVVTATLVVGIMLADDYGPSVDEPHNANLGSQAVVAYLTFAAPSDRFEVFPYHGPFYASVREVVTEVVEAIVPAWVTYDVGHFVYFLSLPIALASLYYIAHRWTSPIAALVATLLFGTQPLIFGHAFINPKDTPFLAFFLASIALGLFMVDKIDPQGPWVGTSRDRSRGAWSELRTATASHFRKISRRRKGLMVLLVLLAVMLSFELLSLQRWIRPGLLELIRLAHAQQAWAPINKLFLSIAEKGSEIPVELYLNKVEAYYASVERSAAIISFAPALLMGVLLVAPVLGKIRPVWLLQSTIAAGVTLGLAASIRPVGPLAGFLISLAAAAKAKRGSIVPLVFYWATTGFVAYATWPYLWGAPLRRYWETITGMSEVGIAAPILFRGAVHWSAELPRYYIPYILGAQLTIPALLLGIAGLILAVHQILRRSKDWQEKFLVILWVLIPLIIAMASVTYFYDNARHYLFILPPLFLLAALVIDKLLRHLKSKAIAALAIAIILLPGVISIVRLHPYEYVYYNELVGGVNRAYRNYELDYWVTSYREAIELVNEIAPPDAKVYIEGWGYLAWHVAREDLVLVTDPANALDSSKVDYLIVTTRANVDIPYQSGTEQVGAVTVDEAILSYVLKVLD